VVLVPEADGLLRAGVGCAIAAMGAAINVAANSNERAFVIIVFVLPNKPQGHPKRLR